jgi:multidrug efflux system membrane fusion protein
VYAYRSAGRFGLALLLAVAGCQRSSVEKREGPHPVPVTVAEVVVASVPREIPAVGIVEASSTVEVVPQVTGVIEAVHFAEGDFVEAGALLFSIDTRPYSATLAVARADAQRNAALLEQARAEAARAEALHREGLTSAQELQRLQADAHALEATRSADRARIEGARLDVQYATVRAPVAGRTGALLKKAGNLVRANDPNPLVVIRALSPVYVRFPVSEQRLGEVRAGLDSGQLAVRATPRGAADTCNGTVSFLDNSVDPSTGTIALKAIFDNRDQRLWPGQFVDVVLELGRDERAVVAPEAAVQRGQEGSYVYALDGEARVSYRRVEVARTLGARAVIASGLEVGERVVTDGQIRLKDGATVTVQSTPTAQQEAR